MRFGSLFSGIEAASVAWKPLGWKCAWVCETDRFASAVLAHHYPEVPNLGDVTKVDWDAAEPVDLVVGGTPCQDFSVAGLRKGLDGARGNLSIEFFRIVGRLRPRWVVFENVPGLLSMDEGRAFGFLLGLLGEWGYGFAWRVLDAQYSGVPQQRRRVFVVGYLGDWRPPAAVLFDQESLLGHPAPRREAGQGVARPVAASTGGSDENDARALNAHGGPHGRLDFESETFVTHSLRASFDAGEDGTGRGTPLVPHAFNARQDVIQYGDKMGALDTDGHTMAMAFSCKDHGADAGGCAPTLRAMGHSDSHANGGGQLAVAFQENLRAEVRITETVGALTGGGGKPGQGYPATMTAGAVRRLTPVECERLMGFPDGYTAVPYRGKPAADGPRYKALGNSMAIPDMRWIGRRIAAVDLIRPPSRPGASPPSPAAPAADLLAGLEIWPRRCAPGS